MEQQEHGSVVRQDVMATPYAERTGPGILVIHSGRGQTEFIDTVCNRLAHNGFVAYAPDLFDGETPTTVEESVALKQTLSTDEWLRRLEDAAEFLQNYSAVSRQHIGVLGIGFGGELALHLVDSTSDGIGAVSVYYGYADIDWGGLTVPFLGHFAELDSEVPTSLLRDAREQSLSTSPRAEFKVYAGTEPSFFEDEDTARYDPIAARKSWKSTLQFFQETLSLHR